MTKDEQECYGVPIRFPIQTDDRVGLPSEKTVPREIVNANWQEFAFIVLLPLPKVVD